MVETNGKGRSRRRVKQSIGQRIAERMHTESRRWAAVCLIIAMVSGNCGNSLFPAWAATEEKETYVVSYMVDPLGAAEVIGKEEVTEGSDLKFTIVPENGCVVEEVWVNGENYLERDPEEVELATDSDATPSDAKATASDWEETDGSYTFLVPSVDCDIDVEIHMTGWDEVWYDTKIYTEKIGDALIRADVKDGTFDEEVTMVAVRLEQDSDAYTEVGEKMEAEGYDVVAYDAFDITFINEQGDEVEPSKPVSVSVEYEQTWKPEEAENVATEMKVLHLHEERLAELGDAKIQENENGELEKVSVDMDEFSVVTVAAIRSTAMSPRMQGSTAEPIDWAVSKSKVAENLDGNMMSKITLSLPAADYKRTMDVVFVLDDTHSGSGIFYDAVEQLLTELSGKETLDINVGVVAFDAVSRDWLEVTSGGVYSGLAPISEEEAALEAVTNAIGTKLDKNGEGQQKKVGATNTEWPIEMATEILEKGTGEEKFLIMFSDLYGYVYRGDLKIGDETYHNVPLSKRIGTWDQGSMSMGTKYDSFEEAYTHRNDEENRTKDGFFRDSSWDPYWTIYQGLESAPENTIKEESKVPSGTFSGFEKSLGLTYDRLLDASEVAKVIVVNNSFYTGDSKHAQTMVQEMLEDLETEGAVKKYVFETTSSDDPIEGDELTGLFADIKEDLIQVVDAGSYVVDEIGSGTDYNFDFVNDLSTLSLVVNKEKLNAVEIKDPNVVGDATAVYQFGNQENDNQFRLRYYQDGTTYEGENYSECFVWEINVPIMKDAPVELEYFVRLTNPKTRPGTYGVFDEDGSKGEAGLFTNNSATLYPTDSNNVKGEAEVFNKPTVSYTVDGTIEKPFEWQTDKSKFATELDKNTLQSKVTLALPSGEKELVSDVVFVWDKSDCEEPVAEEAAVLVDELLANVEANGAKIKVGAIVFGGNALTTFDLQELTADNIGELKAAVKTNPGVTSGTNIQAGLLAADEMLSEDTEVSDTRKYIILVTDGLTRVFNGEDGKTKIIFNEVMADWICVGGEYSAWANAKGIPEGSYQIPGGSWDNYYADIKAKVEKDIQDGDIYITDFAEVGYESWFDPSRNPAPEDIQVIPFEETGEHALSVDRAFYEAYNTYLDLAKKYHCNAVVVDDAPLGIAFVDAVNNGKEVDFDTIKQEILYLVDAGSYIEDYIGFDTYNGYSYDFDFINKADAISLTVGGEELTVTKITETKYGFGASDAGRTADGDPTYPFILEYHPGEKKADEHFIWHINTAISNFAQVRLEYTVQLMNPPETAGTYGIYDGYGVGNKGGAGEAGLYTNTRATLYPLDSEGNRYEAEDFKKPTVVYTVEKTEEPTDPDPDPDPDTPTDPDPDTPTDPDPDTPTDPDPDTPSRPNGSNGGGGGGGGSRTPGTDTTGGPGTVTIVSEGVPLASAPELVEIPAEEVPLSALPKTGRESRNAVLLMISSMALAAYLFLQKKKDQENQ